MAAKWLSDPLYCKILSAFILRITPCDAVGIMYFNGEIKYDWLPWFFQLTLYQLKYDIRNIRILLHFVLQNMNIILYR